MTIKGCKWWWDVLCKTKYAVYKAHNFLIFYEWICKSVVLCLFMKFIKIFCVIKEKYDKRYETSHSC